MAEIKNIHKDASWYASYMDSDQGKALVLCQAEKIKELEAILVEHGLDSPVVEVTRGYFTWRG